MGASMVAKRRVGAAAVVLLVARALVLTSTATPVAHASPERLSID